MLARLLVRRPFLINAIPFGFLVAAFLTLVRNRLVAKLDSEVARLAEEEDSAYAKLVRSRKQRLLLEKRRKEVLRHGLVSLKELEEED